ncbi:MAG TPA: nuclear transport factor 2 family protein [Reyranella sp.]|jgi:ketosteroid isomerase-like protein|nr:nuclear transport factor 2 family protein [Reyranella sp.]
MNHSNRQAIQSAYEAFGRGDVNALFDLLADDVHWHASAPGPAAGDYVGKGEVMSFFGKMAEAYGDTFRLEAIDILASESRVVVLTQERAEHKGRPLAFRSAHVYEFEHRKCVRFLSFQDDAFVDFWRPAAA